VQPEPQSKLERSISTARSDRFPGTRVLGGDLEGLLEAGQQVLQQSEIFHGDLNSFVQAYGSKRLDASLLLIPLVGFLPASDLRVRGTLRAIEERLLIKDEFVLRYETEDAVDGLPAGEGAFLACSFWLVDKNRGCAEG
jgi:hypothetical protein